MCIKGLNTKLVCAINILESVSIIPCHSESAVVATEESLIFGDRDPAQRSG